MLLAFDRLPVAPAAPSRRVAVSLCALLALTLTARAQQPQPDAPQQSAPSTTVPNTTAPAPDAAQTPAPPAPAQTQAPAPPGSISEEELKQMLVGKQLYLRGGYLGDSLTFDEHGRIIGHSPQGSYTLSVLQVDHVRLTKHKVELEGLRFGLHFNEQLAYEDSSTSYDKVRITPKKKVVKITIDREMVVSPKKKKEPKEKAKAAAIPAPAAATNPVAAPATTASPDSAEPSEADQLKASIAATPEAERPADPTSVTTTTSQAHANKLLRDALDAIFAPGLDDSMMAAMPDFWKLYYQGVAAKADYRPADAAIRKAKFSPAIKNGQPVPVMLDLVVQFRIFSNRTAASAAPATPEAAQEVSKDKPAETILPGPYSVAHH
jgi:hypothetical protein